MSGQLLHVTAAVICPHGGQARPVPAQSRVLVSGSPVATTADAYPVVGCALPRSGAPPCTTVGWLGPAGRVRAGGLPVLLATSTGTCRSPARAPQGIALVPAVQQRVRAR